MSQAGGGAGFGVRFRMGAVCAVLCAMGGLVVATSGAIMLRDGPQWRKSAARQRARRLRLKPRRGTLEDRSGAVLAMSVEVPSVSLDARRLLRGVPAHRVAEVARSAAERIAQALALDPARVERRILERRRFAWLKHRIAAAEVEAVRALARAGTPAERLRGLRVEPERHRYYPGRSLAGPTLGFVSPDGRGRSGLELALDTELAGRQKHLRGLHDRRGRPLFLRGLREERSLSGRDVRLTLSARLQHVAETELDRALRTFEVRWGSVVVLGARTGEVLALASAPGFNPNDYRFSEPAQRRVRPVQDAFEPGSTFKIFTIAAALDAGVVGIGERMDCQGGNLSVGAATIRDTHPAGELPLSEVLALSSNVCAAKLGLRLGAERLHDYLHRFGFGQSPELPLPGVGSGVLLPRERSWVPLEVATAAFGQGLMVTNLQLALGAAAIANEGELMDPIVVREVRSAEGEVLHRAAPRVRRRVVARSVARSVAEMMVTVTERNGTGQQAALGGYRVAGKTGTAQKADPQGGGYWPGHYTSSFVGFLPAEDPAVVISVVLDEPALDHGGGIVAAPVFRRVAGAAMHWLDIEPHGLSRPKIADLAPVDPARTTYAAFHPTADSVRRSLVAGPEPLVAAAPRIMPDLRGLSMRHAVQDCLQIGVLPRMEGSGRLTQQSVPPGAELDPSEVPVLHFEPES